MLLAQQAKILEKRKAEKQQQQQQQQRNQDEDQDDPFSSENISLMKERFVHYIHVFPIEKF